jgi:hypothetical protein
MKQFDLERKAARLENQNPSKLQRALERIHARRDTYLESKFGNPRPSRRIMTKPAVGDNPKSGMVWIEGVITLVALAALEIILQGMAYEPPALKGRTPSVSLEQNREA